LKHVGANIRHKVQIVISGAFNNKSVHFVGVIIVSYITLKKLHLHWLQILLSPLSNGCEGSFPW
jgi:hypothetical protein